MATKNTEKKPQTGISPERAAKINKYVGEGLIFACGVGAGAVGATYYYCGKVEDALNKVQSVQKVSQQDLLDMLSHCHSKDEMYNITSKLLYGEMRKTEKMLKDIDTPDLNRLHYLQKRALCDVQDVIKIRSENTQGNDLAVRQAEIKFQESFGQLQQYTKEQMLRSLGMKEGELKQTQVKSNDKGLKIQKPVKTR